MLQKKCNISVKNPIIEMVLQYHKDVYYYVKENYFLG